MYIRFKTSDINLYSNKNLNKKQNGIDKRKNSNFTISLVPFSKFSFKR